MEVEGHLGILARRLEELVSSHFKDKVTVDNRGLSFLGKRDLLLEALDKVGAPPVAYGLSVRERFDFETRIVSADERREAFVALFVRLRTRWHSDTDFHALAAAGVDLRGLYVVRRHIRLGESRVVGKIEKLEASTLTISDSPEGCGSIDAGAVTLEPSKECYSRVLGTLLSFSDYSKLQTHLDELQNTLLDGPAVEQALDSIRAHLVQFNGNWRISEDIGAQFGSLVTLANKNDYTSVIRLDPVSYYFDPGRSQKDTWAWRGLNRYGPFDQESFPHREPRLLLVCTDTSKGHAEQFVQSLLGGVKGRDEFNGFRSVFRIPNVAVEQCVVPWFESARHSIGELYRDTIDLHLRDNVASDNPRYDAAVVVIPDEHAQAQAQGNPYLRSKAVLLQNGIPTQQAKMSTVRGRNPYALQNLATALYAKMKGTPWTVAQDQTVGDELVIGIGMVEQGDRFGPRRRLVGITTVFRGDGNYLLGYVAEQCSYADYPRKLKSSMLQVLRRRKREHGWQPGDTVRIVCHSYQRLKDIEVDRIVSECIDEVGSEQNVEFAFLTVTKDHPFTLLDIHQHGIRQSGNSSIVKAVYLPDRGIIARINNYARLVTTLGPSQARHGERLKRPVLVKLHRLSSFRDLAYLSEQVLKFSSLSWRTVRPVKLPVTIRYSKHIAEQLGELSKLDDWSPVSLNTRLSTSLWFL